MLEIPQFIQEILEKLDQKGYESYIVGGSLRDLLLGKTPKDWDLCTSATPQEIQEIFPNALTFARKYGTITLPPLMVQITTFRAESDYHDHRHPQVCFVKEIKQDLQRRDFTINAMAYHPKTGIIDPFGGAEDLQKGILACVGDAKTRFTEDALRILRLVRFSASLGFQIQPKTLKSAFECKTLLLKISKERIKEELIQTFRAKYFFQAFKTFQDILLLLSPSLSLKKNFNHLHNLQNEALLLAHLYDSTQALKELQVLTFSKQTLKRLETLLRYKYLKLENNPIAIKKMLRIIGYDEFCTLLELHKQFYNTKPIFATLQHIMISQECFSLQHLQINGNTLKSLAIPPQNIGILLNQLLDEVIENKLANTPDSLLERVKELC